MHDTPKISVLLPVHNGMPFLAKTVESVFSQTFQSFELLIIDDGSTDHTPAYVDGLSDPRVRYHRLERVNTLEKVGTPKALNYGLRVAAAPLVARIDADDIAHPERLAKQFIYINEHPECVVVGCQAEDINQQGNVIGERRFPKTNGAIRWQMLFGCPFLAPGTIYRCDAVRSCGGYNVEYWLAEDYELWTRLSSKGKLSNLSDKLMSYRVHADSVTMTNTEAQVKYCAKIAARYAMGISQSVDSRIVEELYYFLFSGKEPRSVDMADLSNTYRKLKHDFMKYIGECSCDLEENILLIQWRLRWRCIENAQRNLIRPWKAWNWLHRAGQFDPERGTISQILRHGVSNLFR